jgi:hypothetical protein
MVLTIFTLIGISPTIPEEALCDSPSRIARICAAYYQFARGGHHEKWYTFSLHTSPACYPDFTAGTLFNDT